MKLTALLPMKGHSERVPNKNMRMFAGKPLYHCIAEKLQQSEYIEQILIDTDSTLIAEDALKQFPKSKIITRPKKIQGDMVPMNDIIAHDLNCSDCSDCEYFLQTHSTNPLLTLATLNQAIQVFFKSVDSYDSLFSVTRLQTRLYWESGKPVNHDPSELLRTQDLPPLYEENSNMYIFSKQSFLASGKKRIGLNPHMFPINKIEAMDIDEEEDFILAETLYKLSIQGA